MFITGKVEVTRYRWPKITQRIDRDLIPFKQFKESDLFDCFRRRDVFFQIENDINESWKRLFSETV